MIDDFTNPPAAPRHAVDRAPETLVWRAYEPGRDAQPLAGLFRAAILTLAASHYDAAQREAWASGADDLDEFDARLARGVTIVACSGTEYAAFGQLFPGDHVEMLYVAPAWTRRGLASALIARLEAIAREAQAVTLDTDASALARPVFERAGFSLVAQESVRRGSVSLPRFHLCKPLNAVSFSG
ncbi:GNAT family N-acetyltransferase [Burkholderia sp. Ax-1719]|uniref:GNAT family N-acetyltransferase n=1 Tax=Burkholderia sp. Ax-1719 TaxID=2608334 RepID=UPI00141E35D9|nr:GNAT family N-acetyltransferase [Burkholderia sp. Ax-1719]NIE65108.1 GNAT family N-acetyltransferase [Burkholderia sp. Ax-1719]